MQWFLTQECSSDFRYILLSMGFQRKILTKRNIQVADAGIPQTAMELRLLKTKRPREDEYEEASRQLTPAANDAGTQGALHDQPPPPKKARLVLGCSLDGLKVLSVDLRCILC